MTRSRAGRAEPGTTGDASNGAGGTGVRLNPSTVRPIPAKFWAALPWDVVHVSAAPGWPSTKHPHAPRPSLEVHRAEGGGDVPQALLGLGVHLGLPRRGRRCVELCDLCEDVPVQPVQLHLVDVAEALCLTRRSDQEQSSKMRRSGSRERQEVSSPLLTPHVTTLSISPMGPVRRSDPPERPGRLGTPQIDSIASRSATRTELASLDAPS